MSPCLFDSAISSIPRMRDWMFSSAMPGAVPANASARISSNAAMAEWIGSSM
jgi:hypothetical protein